MDTYAVIKYSEAHAWSFIEINLWMFGKRSVGNPSGLSITQRVRH